MVEDYVKIIWKAQEWPGESVSTTELAGALGVTPSSVSANLKRLARDGFIDYEPYGRIGLTDAGRDIAVLMVRRHRLLETYLYERLGLSWDEVHAEADTLEHAVSDRVLERMDDVLGHPTRDPHGDLIPGADGSVTRTEAVLLARVEPGAGGEVVRISDREPAILRYLEARQITVGTHLRVDAKNLAAGSLSVSRSGGDLEAPESVEIAGGAADAVWVSAGTLPPG